jgi:hypothetical protein
VVVSCASYAINVFVKNIVINITDMMMMKAGESRLLIRSLSMVMNG